MTSDPVVLVAMSIADAATPERLREIAANAGATLAHLQLGDPSLGRELDRLADADTVTLVGVTLGGSVPGVSWLRRTAAHWWCEHPKQRPEVQVATTILRDPARLSAVLTATKPITGDEAALTSAAWEDVPRHRHQVFVCRGPRCTAKRSDETAEALQQALDMRGLGDDDVLVTMTGCQFPCNHAPVISVQPDDVWYGSVVPVQVSRIVTEHLAGGRPCSELALRRERRAD